MWSFFGRPEPRFRGFESFEPFGRPLPALRCALSFEPFGRPRLTTPLLTTSAVTVMPLVDGMLVREVERDLLPSKLCEYIFDLSGKFNQFYEQCPVMKAETEELQRSRLALCSLTASVLRLSLGLLGIDTLERL